MKRRIAACQMLSRPGDDHASNIIKWIAKAGKEKVNAMLFPECALSSYEKRADFMHDLPREGFAKEEKRIAQAARKHKVAVIVGTVYWEEDKLRNGVIAIDSDGTVRGRYTKSHLADSWSIPGSSLPIYKLAKMKSCFIICHDARYPELVRLPAARGAQICWNATNGSGLLYEYKFTMSRALPIARAAENDIFVVMCNAPADPKNVEAKYQSIGKSMIVNPEGVVLAEAGHFEETLLIADIDTRDARRRWALRALNDDTILRDWMRQGVDMVDDQS